ncbi:MAG: ABC transporter ATP-binding protein [Peptoniphilus sp.]|nr:ABC transporter ATP-binding protein [Peptoniphilus sp.]MDD7362657.1 ABC transporter ATP-binding protein [Bacillota bacterium]MDY6044944.1 ABC transporter ATP-binding protein [Peptoniphilus sp.]
MENVIEISGLNKKYENFQLSDVSMNIPRGCVAGFIGLNGAGKTTTIRTMLGLSKKDGGTIKLLGRDIDEDEKGIKDEIGVVFDEGYLYESLKMREMKSIVANAYTHWDEATYARLMERFGLREEQGISTLSKGMKMKFALALALSHNAKLLIMDEPTSGLDPLVRKELLDILAKFMEKGGEGVFYSSHITSDLEKFADVIVFIDDGEIVLVEDKDYLLDSHVLVKGDNKFLNNENRKYFIDLHEGEYGFSGVTNRRSVLEESIPDLVCEKVDIETLMLAYVQGGRPND